MEQGAASPPLALREQAGAAAAVVEREGRTAATVVELLYGLHVGKREEQAARGEKEAGTQTSSAHRSPRAEDSTSPYSAHPPHRREEAAPPSPRLVLSAFLPRFLLCESFAEAPSHLASSSASPPCCTASAQSPPPSPDLLPQVRTRPLTRTG